MIDFHAGMTGPTIRLGVAGCVAVVSEADKATINVVKDADIRQAAANPVGSISCCITLALTKRTRSVLTLVYHLGSAYHRNSMCIHSL